MYNQSSHHFITNNNTPCGKTIFNISYSKLYSLQVSYLILTEYLIAQNLSLLDRYRSGVIPVAHRINPENVLF